MVSVARNTAVKVNLRDLFDKIVDLLGEDLIGCYILFST